MSDTAAVRWAWRVTWGGVESVVSETSASRARRAVHRSACDAGYRAKYLEVRAVRAPEFDGWAARTRCRVVDEAFARREMAEMGLEKEGGAKDMGKIVVYTAGPITRGDLRENVRRACEASVRLLKAGFAVVNPHGSCYWGQTYTECGRGCVPEVTHNDIPHEAWYSMDAELVARSDAVLRLPGESVGADRETAHAEALGIPVYHDVETLIASPPARRLP